MEVTKVLSGNVIEYQSKGLLESIIILIAYYPIIPNRSVDKSSMTSLLLRCYRVVIENLYTCMHGEEKSRKSNYPFITHIKIRHQ